MVAWHHGLIGYAFEQTPGDSEGQEILVCCSPWGHRVRCDLATEQQQMAMGSLTSLSLGFLTHKIVYHNIFSGLMSKAKEREYKKTLNCVWKIKEKLFISTSTSAAHHLCIFCRLYLQASEAGDEMGLLDSKSGKSGKDKEPSH